MGVCSAIPLQCLHQQWKLKQITQIQSIYPTAHCQVSDGWRGQTATASSRSGSDCKKNTACDALPASCLEQCQAWSFRNTRNIPSAFPRQALSLFKGSSTGGQYCLKHCTQSPQIPRLLMQEDCLVPTPPLRGISFSSPFYQNYPLFTLDRW